MVAKQRRGDKEAALAQLPQQQKQHHNQKLHKHNSNKHRLLLFGIKKSSAASIVIICLLSLSSVCVLRNELQFLNNVHKQQPPQMQMHLRNNLGRVNNNNLAYNYSRVEERNGEDLPSALKQQPTCEINSGLTDMLTNLDLGWDDVDNYNNATTTTTTNNAGGGGGGAPKWLKAMCPEVVSHYDRFPSFKGTPTLRKSIFPLHYTNNAAQAICTMKVVKLLAASIQSQVYLHAGAHLGAIIHGQPIPWDDDVDMLMPYMKKKEFMEACNTFGEEVPIYFDEESDIRVELHCVVGYNAIKVWLQYPGMKKETPKSVSHYSPFVDLFLFKIESGTLYEVSPKGKRQFDNQKKTAIVFNTADYFPTRPYYFGGVHFIGPQPQISEKRFAVQNCIMAVNNHRLEKWTGDRFCLDCQKLYKVFPFVYDNSNSFIKVYDRVDEQQLLPPQGAVFQPLTDTTIEQRKQWFNASSSEKQSLTDAIPNLNAVEIDNSISPLDECRGNKLKVIEFNAERGKRWLESTELLKDADVIILNEMDIGMARSDQQHTTRLMAYYLGMNYAWGLEFVELTLGDQGDRDNIHSSEQNFHGLHGNAILSKCKISNTTIFRNQVGSYFSNEPNSVNAKGLERRLGGRMIMLGRIMVNGTSVVIGSTHKLRGFREEVKEYIHSSPTVIAGDQVPSFCGDVGLNVIVSDPKHHTFPASCTRLGGHRGDNICSNLKIAKEEYTLYPCVRPYGVNLPRTYITLGDHALTGAVFELPLTAVASALGA